MKYKVVIFDLDGTLLDTLKDLANAVNYALSSNNYPTRTIEEIKSFIGNGTRVLIKRALPQDTSAESYELVYQDFINYYKAHNLDFTHPYKDIKTLLSTLKEKGYKTAIISNKNDDATKLMQKEYFSDLIDVAIGTRNFSKTKPNPESTLEVMDILNVDKKQCVFVGDSEVDILTAKNAKIPCISVSWGFKSREFLEKNGATIIIDEPLDLLKHI
ncbi:MAG: HAD family hydrolase [Erysipelotrichales bacterium]|nr:HAD family hydrolase [Erysipelotrichales bacterium]